MNGEAAAQPATIRMEHDDKEYASLKLPRPPSTDRLGDDDYCDGDEEDGTGQQKKEGQTTSQLFKVAAKGCVDAETGEENIGTEDILKDKGSDTVDVNEVDATLNNLVSDEMKHVLGDSFRNILSNQEKVESSKSEELDVKAPRRESRRERMRKKAMTKLFGDDYNPKEAKVVLIASWIIALNSGFVNGTTMSGLLIQNPNDPPKNPSSQMVAGFAGGFTNMGLAMAEGNWPRYGYNFCICFSYMFGSFLASYISPYAKPYVIEPRYGPTFMIGGTFLLLASLFATYELQSRFVFFLVTASNGVQNGIASIYSANLIRCTLTGAVTDVGIVTAQVLHKNYKGLVRGIVLAFIIFFFWLGGLLSYWAVRVFGSKTLYFNVGFYYICGIAIIMHLVLSVGVSFQSALFGTWKWKDALSKLDNGDGTLTREKLMQIFDTIDQDGDGSGDIDADELIFGLKKADVKMTNYEINTLFRAADENGDGVIDRDEWEHLVKKIV